MASFPLAAMDYARSEPLLQHDQATDVIEDDDFDQ